jgi:MFS family permease
MVRKGRYALAHRVLARIGGDAYADFGVAEIRGSIGAETRVRIGELLTPGMLRILGIGVALAVLQQWAGINVIFNYAEEIYRGAGYSVNGILFNIVITGAINLAFTFVALGFVDRIGRRALMLAGCAGIAVSHTLLGLAYHFGLKGIPVVVLTLCTIGCYAMSLAPVTWVLISEIFPNRVRGLAVSISVSALWIACFVLTFTFPMLNAGLGASGTFWLYAAICLAGFVFVKRWVPETTGRSLEEIEFDQVAAGKI